MKKAIIFGVGKNYRDNEKKLHELYDVVALVDNNPKLHMGGGIHSVDYIKNIDYDLIIITPKDWKDMYKQLSDMGVIKEKISLFICMPEFSCSDILGYSYWGQHCDDLIIAAVFDRIGINKPSYMDLGANNPVSCSNTCFMYKQGCRGINIEANPSLAKLISVARPEDITLNIGVAVKEGTMNFYKFDETSGINTFSVSEAKKWNLDIREIIELPVTTLKKIVEEYCPDGFPDFLDCDIEGFDYDVLEDYDLKVNGPKVICVEVRSDDIVRFDSMILKKGYFRFCRIGENNIYVRSEYSNRVRHL